MGAGKGGRGRERREGEEMDELEELGGDLGRARGVDEVWLF